MPLATPLLTLEERMGDVDISRSLAEPERGGGGSSSSGCCCFGGEEHSGSDVDKARSRSIDAKLKAEKASAAEDIKLLLLGAGEAGKSTIFKQIQFIYNKTMSAAERQAVGAAIHQQVLRSMHMMLDYAEDNDIELTGETHSRMEAIREQDTLGFALTPEFAEVLRAVWSDAGIQSAFAQRGRYHLMDSTHYFYEKILDISKKGWTPSDQDVIHARIMTTGISEMSFTFHGYRFKVIDVGGQRSERRKWIHCFEDVTAVIFIASLSEYDCMLAEEQTVNRMHESLVLFSEICNSPYFAKTSIILFLNKRDLFAEKIRRIDLNVCFPEYTGGCDEKAALEFITAKFQAVNRNPLAKTIYTHVTCATQTEQVKFVLNSVQDIVLQENLRGSGII